MSAPERVRREAASDVARRQGRPRVPWGLVLGVSILAVLVAGHRRAPGLLAALPKATGLAYALQPLEPSASPTTDAAELAELAAEVAELEGELATLAPASTYLVVDRANNRLWVRSGEGVVHEAVVSTGSGAILQEAGGQRRRWTFDTPGGQLRILGKRANPVWVKPDWAFLEEGKAPPVQLSERAEAGTLGEWALDLGDGYMIHGTLYERLLGRSLTHGCIRVGRDDLRVVVGASQVGTPVFIF